MLTDPFPQFWQTYPRKVGKKEALKAWSKLTPEQRLKAMEAIPTHVRYWEVCNTDKPFIPHASTWLNGWRFDDELEMPQEKKRDDWTANDSTICAKAAELGIWSQGKDKFQLIREIRERMAA